MNKRAARDKLFRETLAAILASKLRLHELRDLAELLQDSYFSRDLSRAIWGVTTSLSEEPQEELFIPEEDVLQEERGSPSGIVDLTYSVVQRRRLSKAKIFSIFREISPKLRWSNADHDLPVREIIRKFIGRADTFELQNFLNYLGMDVAQDPFLGGITERLTK